MGRRWLLILKIRQSKRKRQLIFLILKKSIPMFQHLKRRPLRPKKLRPRLLLKRQLQRKRKSSLDQMVISTMIPMIPHQYLLPHAPNQDAVVLQRRNITSPVMTLTNSTALSILFSSNNNTHCPIILKCTYTCNKKGSSFENYSNCYSYFCKHEIL